MKKFYLFLFLLVTGILVGTFFFFYLWNRPKKDISKQKADFSLSTKAFISDFEKDTASANGRYNSKVVQLYGNVAWSETDRQNNIHLFFQDGQVVVQCTLEKKQNKEGSSVKKGDTVTIKGDYTGFEEFLGLTIKLNNCILLTPRENTRKRTF